MSDNGLRIQLRTYRIEEAAAAHATEGATNTVLTRGQVLKLAVEAYWRDPAAVTNAPRFSPRMLPHRSAITNAKGGG
jgi:hypothetical protein